MALLKALIMTETMPTFDDVPSKKYIKFDLREQNRTNQNRDKKKRDRKKRDKRNGKSTYV